MLAYPYDPMTREIAGVVPEGLLGSDLLKLIKELEPERVEDYEATRATS